MQTEIKEKKSPNRRGIFRVLLATTTLIAAGIAVGTLTGRLPLMLTGVCFAGALAAVLAFLRPDLSLYVYFSGVVITTDAAPATGGDFFFIPDVDVIKGLPPVLTTFFLLIFFASAARRIFLERKPFPVSLRGLGVYLVILCVALLTGFLKSDDQEIMRVDLMNMLFPVLCFYLCMLLLFDHERIYRLLTVLLAVSALKALVLTVFYIGGRGWPYDTYRIATQDSADLLVFITLVLIVLYLLVRGDIRGFRAGLAATACLPMLFVIIFAYRRAQWVGLGFSLGLLYLGAAKPVRRRLAILLMMSLCAGGALAVATGLSPDKLARITSRLSSVFDKKQHSNAHHLLESQVTLRDLSRSPLLGMGLGGHHSPLAGYNIPTNVVHNTFLYIWMKIGMAGLLFFLWAAGLYAWQVFRIRRDHSQDPRQSLILPLAASSGLWLAMFLTGPVPWYFHQTSLLALFSAMGMSLILQADNDSKTQPGVPI